MAIPRQGWLFVLYAAVLVVANAVGFAVRQAYRAGAGEPFEAWTLVLAAAIAAAGTAVAVQANRRRKEFSAEELATMRAKHERELAEWKRQARPPST